jgi:hypothetical protein
MKKFIFPILVVIIAAGWLTYKDAQYDRMVFEYEQELRMWHEIEKAYEARLMYLEMVLDDNGIKYVP